ncbi:glycosyltransferase family 4 protein [Patescibacteria group bacterium]|nr:glycosyltransferase family 4 protein [Patescibacteria group bacterium]MCG2687349.1 glycosyltransferase family 4 protein [Candidatus Parcubacteria bacterium]
MKIVQITPVYSPYAGGIGSVAQEYALALSKDGNDVKVFTPMYDPNVGLDANISRIKPWYKWGNAALVPQLIWKLRNFDILHLHYPFYGGAESTALASLIWRKPLVITYHMRPVASGWQEGIFRLYRLLIEPIIFLISKKILVSSFDYAKSVGLKSKKLIELPFSVDTDRFAPGDAPEIRASLGIDDNAKVIIFVGGLDDAHYFKGVDVLLEACSLIRDDVNWHLIIVGDGNLRQKYQDKALNKNISSRVYFAGRVDNDDLPKYYQASDIHVLPAINRCEAYGLVTLEAGSSGLPSIVSNLPGVRILVKNRETGLIAQPNDAKDLAATLTFLLQNNELRKRFGKSARARIEARFSRSKVLDKLKELYVETIK